jgi:hypothetical protein
VCYDISLIECRGSQACVEKKFGGITPKKPLISKVCGFFTTMLHCSCDRDCLTAAIES